MYGRGRDGECPASTYVECVRYWNRVIYAINSYSRYCSHRLGSRRRSITETIRISSGLIWRTGRGKAVSPAAPRSGRHRRPSCRMRKDARDHRFDFIQESCAQTVLGGFVERNRFLEFRFRGGSESRIHFRKSLRRSEKTVPASRALACRPRRRQFDAPTPRPRQPRATSFPARQENPRAHQSASPFPRAEDSELQPELSQRS